jgi:Tfp pilus assembly protein PilZ
VDYSGLSILAIAYKSVLNHNGMMKLSNISLHIMELFRLVHLDSVFDMYVDEKSAMDSFQKKIFPIEARPLRRRFSRIDIQIPVEYRPKKASRQVKSFKEKILNMSGAGIFIQTHHIFSVDTILELKIHLKGVSEVIDSEGKVIWIADKDLQPHLYPGMGVQFTKIDKIVYEDLLDYIDKNATRRSELFS